MFEKELSREDFLKAGFIGIAGAALFGAAGGASLLEAATGARRPSHSQLLASVEYRRAIGPGGASLAEAAAAARGGGQ